MYKVMFSIPVHESLPSVLDLIKNYNFFNPDCGLILHVSKKFKEISVLKKNLPPNVFLNNKSIYSGRADGSQLMMHFLNFKFLIEQDVEFEFFSLNASNEFFIKPDVYNYIKKNDAGFEIDNIKKFLSYQIPRTASRDPFLKAKLKSGTIKEIYYSGVEGSFYKKHIFSNLIDSCWDRIMYDFTFPFKFSYKDYFNNKYFYHLLKRIFTTKFYVTEEIYPATLCFEVTEKRGWPYCYFNSKHNSGFVTVAEIEAIATGKLDQLPRYDRHKDGREFFSVKRVIREDENSIKEFIMNKLMQP